MSDHEALIARLEKLMEPSREMDVLVWCAVGKVDAPEGDYWDHTGPLDPSWIVNGRTMHRAIEMFPGDMGGIARSWEVPDFTASIDAAVALTERMLPGCDICWQDLHADFRQAGEARHIAEVMHDLHWVTDDGFPEPMYQTTGSGKANSRQVALLIATLRATLHGEQPCSETPEMVERVARAICKSRTCEGFQCCEWPAQMGRRHNCPVAKGGYEDAARAAIEAMREISIAEKAPGVSAYVKAAGQCRPVALGAAWQAIIDAALTTSSTA